MTTFEIAAMFFSKKIQTKKTTISIEKIPRSPSTCLLHIKKELSKRETFVIKVPYIGKMSSDKIWTFHLENEILGQSLLHGLGFYAKNYLLYHFDDKPERCFAISTYLPGSTFEKMGKKNLADNAILMLNFLFRLHLRTQSTVYGYTTKKPLPFEQQTIGETETYFLRSDITRDNINLSNKEKAGLSHLIKLFNNQQRFCLCHCDVTLRNSLRSKNNVYLIDWAFCHFTHPAHDIAHVIFWLYEEGLIELAGREFIRAQQRYKRIGFQMGPIFTFYLAQRYIEFGRIRGEYFIDKGKYLLTKIVDKSFDPINGIRKFK